MTAPRFSDSTDQREQLLVDRACGWTAGTFGDMSAPDDAAVDAFEHAAAALQVAFAARDRADATPIPAGLRRRLERDAAQWLAASTAGGTALHALSDTRPTSSAPLPSGVAEAPGTREGPAPIGKITASGLPRVLPWLVTAATLMLSLSLWWMSSRDASAPTAESARRALLREPDTVTVGWKDPLGRGIMGDVVWNQRAQQGFIHVVGLPENDPTEMQYQLWIFDEERGDYSDFIAVDGGVFDVSCADAVVAVDPKLAIGRVTLFAVTSEPPGGVVKHNPQRDPDRFRIELTAALPR